MLNEQISNKDQWPVWACSYRYKDKLWAFDIPAPSQQDAQARIRAMSKGWVEGGPIAETIYIPLPKSTPKPLLVTIGNFLANVIGFLRKWKGNSQNSP